MWVCFHALPPRMLAMIDLYYWTTPNGHKITLFLEEADLDYTIKPINIGKGDQFAPDFLAIAPNNRIPAIVDHEPDDGGEPLALSRRAQLFVKRCRRFTKRKTRDQHGLCCTNPSYI